MRLPPNWLPRGPDFQLGIQPEIRKEMEQLQVPPDNHDLIAAFAKRAQSIRMSSPASSLKLVSEEGARPIDQSI